jgi:cellulose synthase/poly-beta-1,6-N-acetylglucosamine synthase-like glycosyltransferase
MYSGKSETLEETIKSLLNQSYPSNKYEVIVVDENADIISRLEKYQLKVIFRGNRRGLASARNLSLKYAKGEIIAFTDDDCIADKDWLKEIAQVLCDKNVAGVGGIIKPVHADPISKAITLLELVGLASLEKETKAKVYGKRIAGINSAYRTSIIKKVGGWDEKIIYGADDVDLNHRLIKAGYTLKVSPNLLIYHKHRSTISDLFWWSYNLGIGYAYVMKKHHLYARSLMVIIPFLAVFSFSFIGLVLIKFSLLMFIFYLIFLIFFYIIGLFTKGRSVKVKIDILTIILTIVVVFVFSCGSILGRVAGLCRRNAYKK